MLADKHAATVVMAAQRQVCDERLADIVGQRQSGALMTLPVDLDLSDPPVQVLDSIGRPPPRVSPAARGASGSRSRERPPGASDHTTRASARSPGAPGTGGRPPRASARPTAPHRPGRVREPPHAQIAQELAQLVCVAAHRPGRTRVDSPQESRHIRASEAVDAELIVGRDSLARGTGLQAACSRDGVRRERRSTASQRRYSSTNS